MRIDWVSRFVQFLSKYTFAIYLLHWFVMKVLVQEFSIDVYSLAYRLLGPIPIIAIVILITWIVRKIPVVRQLLP